MTARKQLSNKEKVQRKYPGAYAWQGYRGDWSIYINTEYVPSSRIFVGLASGPTPALAWAAAARVR